MHCKKSFCGNKSFDNINSKKQIQELNKMPVKNDQRQEKL